MSSATMAAILSRGRCVNGKYFINVNTLVPRAPKTNSRPATVLIALSLKNASANLIAVIIFVSLTFSSHQWDMYFHDSLPFVVFAVVDNWRPFY